MNSVLSVSRRPGWNLRVFACILAIIGQVGIFGAYLALARDESSTAPHAEQSGVDLHHGHNDATCAACTALSFQATVSAAIPPLVSTALSTVALACSSEDRPTAPQLLPNSCRAPPREA
ncbi:MAG: hypothetical protein ACJ791_03400 [Gemmatimonadaceae bacterium]